MCYRKFTAPNHQVKLTTDRVKVLHVIGQEVAQIVVEGSIPINAVKINRIYAELHDMVDHVFKNKIVKQGVVHKQIFYVDPNGIVRHTAEEIPFMATVDIPGVDPDNSFLDIQNHQLDIAVDYTLIPGTADSPGTLMQKVVTHIMVIVSEWALMDVVTHVDIFPKINSLGQISFAPFNRHPKPFSHHRGNLFRNNTNINPNTNTNVVTIPTFPSSPPGGNTNVNTNTNTNVIAIPTSPSGASGANTNVNPNTNTNVITIANVPSGPSGPSGW